MHTKINCKHIHQMHTIYRYMRSMHKMAVQQMEVFIRSTTNLLYSRVSLAPAAIAATLAARVLPVCGFPYKMVRLTWPFLVSVSEYLCFRTMSARASIVGAAFLPVTLRISPSRVYIGCRLRGSSIILNEEAEGLSSHEACHMYSVSSI